MGATISMTVSSLFSLHTIVQISMPYEKQQSVQRPKWQLDSKIDSLRGNLGSISLYSFNVFLPSFRKRSRLAASWRTRLLLLVYYPLPLSGSPCGEWDGANLSMSPHSMCITHPIFSPVPSTRFHEPCRWVLWEDNFGGLTDCL